jgi:hypothetical protein
VDEQQGQQRDQIAGRVEVEVAGNAPGGQDQPGDGRSDDGGALPQDRVERDGRDQGFGGHQPRHQRLTGRGGQPIDGGRDQRIGEHVLNADLAGPDEQGQQHVRHDLGDLRPDHQPVAVDAVGDHPTDQGQGQDRQRLEGGVQAQRGG